MFCIDFWNEWNVIEYSWHEDPTVTDFMEATTYYFY